MLMMPRPHQGPIPDGDPQRVFEVCEDSPHLLAGLPKCKTMERWRQRFGFLLPGRQGFIDRYRAGRYRVVNRPKLAPEGNGTIAALTA